jgi:hypothetical protein
MLSLQRLKAVIEELQQPVTLDEFPSHAMTVMRKVVDGAVAGYSETDGRARHAVMLADDPGWMKPEFTDIWSFQTSKMYMRRLWEALQCDLVVMWSISDPRFKHLELANGFYRPLRVSQQLVLPFLRETGVVYSLGLSRETGSLEFSQHDCQLLGLISTVVRGNYLNARRQNWQAGELTLVNGLNQLRRSRISLSPDGRIRHMPSEARAWLRRFVGKLPAGSLRLPDALNEWGKGCRWRPHGPVFERNDGRGCLKAYLVSRPKSEMVWLDLELESAVSLEVIQEATSLPEELAKTSRGLCAGKPHSEIAEECECSLGAMDKRIERIRARFNGSGVEAARVIREKVQNHLRERYEAGIVDPIWTYD